MTRRIALISEHASPLSVLGGTDSGGQNVYVGEVSKHLAAAGYEVDVFTRRDSSLVPEISQWVNGVRIIHVPAGPPSILRKEDMFPYMRDFTAWMQRFIKRQRKPYDLIHANFWMSGLVAADLKRALGIPFVITFHALGRVRRLHQGQADQFPDERFAIEDRIVAEANRIIAEAPQEEEDLIRLYNADPARVSIVVSGFDPGEFWPMSKPLARVALGLDPEERTILQLGRMVPRKGVDNVIRGLARLVKQHGITARLLVVGGESDEPDPAITPEIGRLQALAEEEGVADWVTFVGRRGRDVLKYYYNAADVFVSTPWYEPFGITPLESMGCGTPVIGSNVGGIKFTVRDGETGYLVAPNDPDALAERLAHLYKHPKLMELFRRQAIRRANDLFTWDKVVDGLTAVYEQVVTESSPERHEEAAQLDMIDRAFESAVEVFQESQRRLRMPILAAADAMAAAFGGGGKVLICGNGGSAGDAQHFAGELVGRFKYDGRPGLAAIALTADTSFLTGWANDIGYEDVFARQVKTFGKPGDVLIGISTSGRSKNVVRAFEAAREAGLQTVGILGRDGGELKALSDVAVVVPSHDTQRIQEVQALAIHLICELIEERAMAGWPAKISTPSTIGNIWALPTVAEEPAPPRRTRSRMAAR